MNNDPRAVDQAVNEVMGEPGPDDLDQVHADPMDHPPVRVKHDGPIMTQQLPADGPWGSKSFGLAAAAPANCTKLLNPNPQRKHAHIVGTAAFRVGATQADALTSGAVWPPNVPLTLDTTGEVWIGYNAADSVVSAVWESWTR